MRPTSCSQRHFNCSNPTNDLWFSEIGSSFSVDIDSLFLSLSSLSRFSLLFQWDLTSLTPTSESRLSVTLSWSPCLSLTLSSDFSWFLIPSSGTLFSLALSSESWMSLPLSLGFSYSSIFVRFIAFFSLNHWDFTGSSLCTYDLFGFLLSVYIISFEPSFEIYSPKFLRNISSWTLFSEYISVPLYTGSLFPF